MIVYSTCTVYLVTSTWVSGSLGESELEPRAPPRAGGARGGGGADAGPGAHRLGMSERRERRDGGRKGGRRERRRKDGQTLFGEEEEERLPIQLQRPEPMQQPAILKNDAPTPAFKIMGVGADTQRKDVRPTASAYP